MVTVLLAVYNGERYLKEQLDSLLNQTFKNIKIIIRDDGSSDNSIDIINDYCSKYPDKVSCISGKPTGSAAQNFSKLLELCDDDYIMLCDQDDIWLPTKIEKTLAAMIKAESGGTTPVLVHSDLTVVDHKLEVISPSFFDFYKLKQNNITLPRLLVQNYVTGCTVMINRALKQKCGKIPNEAIMHDWWLALVAQIFGKLICINEPTILYRQHERNQVGAKASYGVAYIKQKFSSINRVYKLYKATYTQAKQIFNQFGDMLSVSQKQIIELYCNIPKVNKIKRIYTIHKYGFKKCTRLRVIGQCFLV